MRRLELGPRRALAASVVLIVLASAYVALGAPLHLVRAASAGTPGSIDSLTAEAGSLLPAGTHPYAHHWRNVSPTHSPGVRTQDMLAYDPLLSAVVLFGGNEPQLNYAYGDTWTFAGGNWTQLGNFSSLPAPRWAATFVYDPQLGGIVLFGGRDAYTAYGDTWLFANNSWKNITGSGAPSPRFDAAAAYDFSVRALVLYGGGVGNLPAGSGSAFVAYSDTWTLTTTGWSNATGTVTGGPGPRFDSRMVYFPPLAEDILIGGSNASGGSIQHSVDDTWSFQHGAWTALNVTNQPPGKNMKGELVYDPVLHKAVLFGGQTVTSLEDSDTFVFTGTGWRNISGLLSTLPPPRSVSGLTFDGATQSLVLFGGTRNMGATPENDTWAFT